MASNPRPLPLRPLDVTVGQEREAPVQSEAMSRQRWLGVYFRCARQYTRVFRRDGADQYTARCPSCGQTISFAVDPSDPDASSDRFYQVSC